MTKHDFYLCTHSVFGDYYFMHEIVFIEIPDNTVNFTKMYQTFFFKTSKNDMHNVYSNHGCKRSIELCNENVNTIVNSLSLYYFTCNVRVFKSEM